MHMSDLGGETPCWAHLVDDIDGPFETDRSAPLRTPIVDIGSVGDDAPGASWSLPHGGDLDANLIRLLPNGHIAEHVNTDVDVLVVVWDGSGRLTIDDRVQPVAPGFVVLVPRDARRTIEAGPEGIRYLSIHRRRDGLTIGTR
jgi:quercetin dioxygenase-like cupin family protein